MVINRRQFLAFGSALALLNARIIYAVPAMQKTLACRSDRGGKHFLSMINQQGEAELNIQLPQRGHGICASKDKQFAAVFARRPGNYVWIVDLNTQQVSNKISATNQRHFYGHGVFTNDGSLLLCSENAYESGNGVIGVYDVRDNYVRMGEFPSFGIGPHEIQLLSDGKTLVVANGGIQTHPDSPRIKLNLESMRPNLAYVDITNGQLLHRHELNTEFNQLSIRHIDIAADDTVAIAMQSQGDPYLHPPLIAVQQGERQIKTLTAPDHVQKRLRNYCGSVTFSNDSKIFAVSSPRGGLVTYWSAKGQYLGLHEQADACGVSGSTDNPSEFLVSDGTGAILVVKDKLQSHPYHMTRGWRWDNHMLTL
ncbi:MAG: DUF1513 domain-containing protein [Gammaproteobacteria bacterium]